MVRAFLNISLGRVRRAAGPLSWLAQLALFPTAAIGSTQAAGSAVVLTGALSASSAGIGTQLANDTMTVLDPRDTAPLVSTGRGTVAAESNADERSIGRRDAFIHVTVPPTVIIGSRATTDDFAAASFDIIVVRPATDVPVEFVQPGSPDGGPDAAPPATFAAITTIPPATNAADSAVANPLTTTPPTTTTAVPVTTTTVAAMLTTTTTVVPVTTVPVTTVPRTTVPGTTVPTTTLPTTSPNSTVPAPPVTLPNGRPSPVNTIPANPLSAAGDRVASAAGPPARPDPGAKARVDEADAGAVERNPSPQRP